MLSLFSLCSLKQAPPIPQVRVELLSSAAGFCNVSVNCSAKDIWASYTCDHAHCTQVENTTSLSGVNIIVTATNGIIHCSSSNRVDTKTQSVSTKDLLEDEKSLDQDLSNEEESHSQDRRETFAGPGNEGETATATTSRECHASLHANVDMQAPQPPPLLKGP
ncbi:hypothetical protein SKAU_G00178900 [Synaphobranchus kaupii]|uniref:Uncharacterized protein n=1 Tax=Synaphobranchus kaupii TaxID=118154 RepID=A0A9Q1J1H0_SYNKA|nr:hypothetical protein SKAU_G00178900 [Synaphobranchus kaupii]